VYKLRLNHVRIANPPLELNIPVGGGLDEEEVTAEGGTVPFSVDRCSIEYASELDAEETDSLVLWPLLVSA
jgi:hypothetical protein